MLLSSPPFSRPDPQHMSDVIRRVVDLEEAPGEMARDVEQLVRDIAESDDRPLYFHMAAAGHLKPSDETAEGDPPPLKRLAVEAVVTTRGNLTVKASPMIYGENGRWREAPEWQGKRPFGRLIDLAFERPADELLFFRNVNGLFPLGPGA